MQRNCGKGGRPADESPGGSIWPTRLAGLPKSAVRFQGPRMFPSMSHFCAPTVQRASRRSSASSGDGAGGVPRSRQLLLVVVGVVGDVGVSEGGLLAVALAFEREDVGVVDDAVDGGDRHGLVGEDAFPGLNGWLVVIMSERYS